MTMNCTTCSSPIDKNRGYYLVMGVPYCIDCYQALDEVPGVQTHCFQQREKEDLLDAFRAYQKRNRASVCQSY